MPRITLTPSEFKPRPTGVLKTAIVEAIYHAKGSKDIPNMKHLRASDVQAVIEWHLLPEEHDRVQKVFTPISIKMKDGEVDLKESRGVYEIHGILEQLGLQTAGFAPNGNFVNEDDEVIQFGEDILTYVLSEIIKSVGFRVLYHIYKEKTDDGKSYFRGGWRFYPDTDHGMEMAKASSVKELEYQNTKGVRDSTTQPSGQGPTTPSNRRL